MKDNDNKFTHAAKCIVYHTFHSCGNYDYQQGWGNSTGWSGFLVPGVNKPGGCSYSVLVREPKVREPKD
jgi:hypothetical protein